MAIFVNDLLVGRGKKDCDLFVEVYKKYSRREGHFSIKQSKNTDDSELKVFNKCFHLTITPKLFIEN